MNCMTDFSCLRTCLHLAHISASLSLNYCYVESWFQISNASATVSVHPTVTTRSIPWRRQRNLNQLSPWGSTAESVTRAAYNSSTHWYPYWRCSSLSRVTTHRWPFCHNIWTMTLMRAQLDYGISGCHTQIFWHHAPLANPARPKNIFSQNHISGAAAANFCDAPSSYGGMCVNRLEFLHARGCSKR